jgi:hypothetical protein
MVPALTISVLKAGVWNFDLKAYSFASALQFLRQRSDFGIADEHASCRHYAAHRLKRAWSWKNARRPSCEDFLSECRAFRRATETTV